MMHGWAWLSLADVNVQATMEARGHSWWYNLPQFPCDLSCRVPPALVLSLISGLMVPSLNPTLMMYPIVAASPPPPLVQLKCSIMHILPHSEVPDGLTSP